MALAERDIGPALDLLKELSAQTSYAELIARRRALFEEGS